MVSMAAVRYTQRFGEIGSKASGEAVVALFCGAV